MLTGLDRQVRRDLAAYLGWRPQVLAWGRTVDERWCVALPDRLVWGSGQRWAEQRWHLLERGSWVADIRELRWTDSDGQPGSVRLSEPRRLPEVFADRVAATIVVRQRVPIDGTDDGVVVTGRRDLGDRDAPLRWYATAMRGTSLANPGVAAQADAAVARIRAEYDI